MMYLFSRYDREVQAGNGGTASLTKFADSEKLNSEGFSLWWQ